MAVKNAFATKLRQIKEQSYSDGVWAGLQMGLNLSAISLNHTFGFGDSRLSRLEQGVQGLVNEVVDLNDPELTQSRIEREIKRIRGASWDK